MELNQVVIIPSTTNIGAPSPIGGVILLAQEQKNNSNKKNDCIIVTNRNIRSINFNAL
jgi:hypothetical protein